MTDKMQAGDVIAVLADGTEQTVKPKCDQPEAPGGWFCQTHGHLRNNMEADSHERDGCRLGWFCHAHGEIEVP